MADDVLTINALRAVSSLQVGYAIHFEEHRLLGEISDPGELVATLVLDGTARGASASDQGLRRFEFFYTFDQGRADPVPLNGRFTCARRRVGLRARLQYKWRSMP